MALPMTSPYALEALIAPWASRSFLSSLSLKELQTSFPDALSPHGKELRDETLRINCGKGPRYSPHMSYWMTWKAWNWCPGPLPLHKQRPPDFDANWDFPHSEWSHHYWTHKKWFKNQADEDTTYIPPVIAVAIWDDHVSCIYPYKANP